MQLLFVVLQSILLALFLVQDTVRLPPLNNQPALVRYLGWKKLIIGTLITAGFVALSLCLTVHYRGVPLPLGAKIFFVLWWGPMMFGMFLSWYKPYFFGPTAKDLEMYRELYSGTHTFLPMRNGYPGPNTLHVILHCLMIPCAVLAFLRVAGLF